MNKSEVYIPVAERFPKPSMVIVYNPNSNIRTRNPIVARHDAQRIETLTRFVGPEGLGIDAQFIPTESAEHGRDVVKKAIDDGVGAIGVIGGDGTLAPVAGELIASEHNTHLVAFGGGTENVLQRGLIQSKNPLKIAEATLLKGSPKKIDVGQIQDGDITYPFLTNGSAGFATYAIRNWEALGKKNRAQLFKEFIMTRNNFQTYDLHIKDPVEKIDREIDDVFEAIFSNFGKYGGKFDVLDSDMTDGMVEAAVFQAPQKDLINIPGVIYNAVRGGQTIKGGHYMGLQDATITRTNGNTILFQHDGETAESKTPELRVSTKHQSVTLWVPDNTTAYGFSKPK
jgi:diacylglycerol kinase family enzyme